VTDPAGQDTAVAWWTNLTSRSGEGMVVKPSSFVAPGPAWARPTRPQDPWAGVPPDHLRLALGIESLERFVRGEPLRRIHECVFGVLALESEPVDPRL
jgi:protein phosphatase